MQTSNFNRVTLYLCLAFLFVPSSSHAEIYKWVDANGRTHFSERQDDAGKAKPVELKALSQPPSTHAAKPSLEYWQEQETQFKQRQLQKPTENSSTPSLATKQKSLSGGRSGNSDASRCNLARDVLNGAVQHGNGASTDKYDREVAENDVRAYCH